MRPTLHRILIPSLASTLLVAAACQTISRAPEGSPRVEVEVTININEEFLGALDGVDVDSKLVDIMEESAMSLADVGLRFYPINSTEYGKGQNPEYLLTLDLRELEIMLDHEMIEEGEDAAIETRVDRVACTVATSLEKRRPEMPALLVGQTTATASVRAESKPDVLAAEVGYTKSDANGKPLKVTEKDIVESLKLSLIKALRELEVPIDREFGPIEVAETGN